MHGFEAVKLQTHIPSAEMAPGHPWWDTVSRCSLSEEVERELMQYAAECRVMCFSTPFSVAAVERLERIGVPAYKIGSGEATFSPLLDAVRATGKPWMASCGMGADPGVIVQLGGIPMHCVSEYPTPVERWDLCGMERFAPFDLWGYSDHSVSPVPAFEAVGLGASIVEVHVSAQEAAPMGSRQRTPDAMVEWSFERAYRLRVDLDQRWRSLEAGMVGDKGRDVARMCVRDAEGRRVAE